MWGGGKAKFGMGNGPYNKMKKASSCSNSSTAQASNFTQQKKRKHKTHPGVSLYRYQTSVAYFT